MRLGRILFILLFTGLGALPAHAQEGLSKIALVIANSRYETVPPLANPPRDAAIVEEALGKAGFAVQRVDDANLLAFGASLRAFKRAAETADVALIYYAGHGVEVEGVNFLIPTDARLEDPVDARTEAMPLDSLLAYLAPARRLRIVALDACRDNPFKFRVATRTVNRGLKPVENLPAGTVVAYSAAAGQKALDGVGGEASPFARAFAQRVSEPGLEVSFIFRNVYQDVVAASQRLAPGKSPQEPWYDSKLGAEQIYFIAPVAPSSATFTLTVLGADVRVSDLAAEVEAFDAASKTFTVVAWRDFLTRFPNGRMRPAAQQILSNLERGPQATPPGADPLAAARAALAAITPQEWSAAEPWTLAARAVAASSRTSLEQLAATGDARAQVLVATAYLAGLSGFPMNLPEGVRLLRLSAAQDHPLGLVSLGAAYSRGYGGLEQDDVKAVELFGRAANNGNALGQASLGAMYSEGRGRLRVDKHEAARLYRLAADQGNALGQSNLANMYQLGSGGLKQDSVEAVRLYRLAAAQGNAQGQAGLGLMYERGEGGLPQDKFEARQLYSLSAANGNPAGQAMLAGLYEDGAGGLARNLPEAIRLYQSAARKGYTYAQDQLRRLGETW